VISSAFVNSPLFVFVKMSSNIELMYNVKV